MDIETAKKYMDSEITCVSMEKKQDVNHAACDTALVTFASTMIASETFIATGNYANVLVGIAFIAAASANCIRTVNKSYKTIDYLKEIRHYLEEGVNPFENTKEEDFKVMIKHFEKSENKKHM